MARMTDEPVNWRRPPIPWQIFKLVFGSLRVFVWLRFQTWWSAFAVLGVFVVAAGVKGLARRLWGSDDVSGVDLGATIPIDLGGGPFGIRLVRCDKPVALANVLWETFGTAALAPLNVSDLRAGAMVVANIPADEVQSIELKLTSPRRAWDIERVRIDEARSSPSSAGPGT
jgi:hypothetical protein